MVAQLAQGARERDDIRHELLANIRDARARLDDLEGRLADARPSWETARAKIARPELPTPPTFDPALADAMNGIADRANAEQWYEARRALDALGPELDSLAAAIDASTEASRTALETRDHLRGRLDAYRAKAHGLGLDEDDEVTAAYERALAALHTAPADLIAAESLVVEYQQLLSPVPEPEVRR
jgi:hypothetical protein